MPIVKADPGLFNMQETPTAVVSYRFDDNMEAGDVRTLMESTGSYGSLYFVTGDYAGRSLPSESYLHELEDAGWEIGSHSVTHYHPDNDNPTDEEIDTEMKNSRDTLLDMGLSVDTYAHPNGTRWYEQYRRIAARYYKCAADSPGEKYNLPPVDRWGLRTLWIDGMSDADLVDQKAYVDDAIATGGWIIFAGHPMTLAWDAAQIARFEELVNYVVAADIDVQNVTDAYDSFANVAEYRAAPEHFAVGRDGKIEASGVRILHRSDDSAGITVSRIHDNNAAADDYTGISFNINYATNIMGAPKAGIFFEATASYQRGKVHIAATDATGWEDGVVIGDARLTVQHDGNVGIGTTSPSALLEIAAGSTALAPIILNSGAVLTTPVAGAIEFDGTNLYFTNDAGARQQIAVV